MGATAACDCRSPNSTAILTFEPDYCTKAHPHTVGRMKGERGRTGPVAATLLRRGWTDQRQYPPYQQANNQQRECDKYDLHDQDRSHEKRER